jgi:hypothetical protein
MDLFGRKRIRQLEEDLAQKDDEYTALSGRYRDLVRTIRDMDQEIWNMGQKTAWEAQRPHFVKLHDEMTARKVTESNRIGDVLRGEIIDTYNPSKRLGNG